MENKKTRPKKYYQANRKNCKKYLESITEIFLKIRKLKKEITLTLEIKICHMKIKEEKGIKGYKSRN